MNEKLIQGFLDLKTAHQFQTASHQKELFVKNQEHFAKDILLQFQNETLFFHYDDLKYNPRLQYNAHHQDCKFYQQILQVLRYCQEKTVNL